MYDVINLSEYIITKCIKENHLINSMQLQYILYYIQKAFLIKKDKLAFPDDIRVKAWGPAISSVMTVIADMVLCLSSFRRQNIT